MEGAERHANSINFYKNLSIAGGFLLLYVTGAGKYSVDAKLGLAEHRRYGAGLLERWGYTRPITIRRHPAAASTEASIILDQRQWQRPKQCAVAG